MFAAFLLTLASAPAAESAEPFDKADLANFTTPTPSAGLQIKYHGVAGTRFFIRE